MEGEHVADRSEVPGQDSQERLRDELELRWREVGIRGKGTGGLEGKKGLESLLPRVL
jgi:hypothetical protein